MEASTTSRKSDSNGVQIFFAFTVLIGLAIWAGISAYTQTHNKSHLSVTGKVSQVDIIYKFTIPHPQVGEIASQETHLTVSAPWETDIDITGLDPIIDLTVIRKPNDDRPLGCAVTMGSTTDEKGLSSGQNSIVCSAQEPKPPADLQIIFPTP